MSHSSICTSPFVVNFVVRSLYALVAGGALVIVVLEVIMKRPENLICLAGLALLIIFCFFISTEPEKVSRTSLRHTCG